MAHNEHYLTHAQMREIAARGESILYHAPGGGKSVLYHSGNPLPSEAELAKGDGKAEAAALANIDAEIARLAAQRALLTAQPAAKAEPDAGSGKPPKKADTAPDDAAGAESK